MKLGKKIFPYPVLNNSKTISGFCNDNYELMLNERITDEEFILENTHINIDNTDIEQFLHDGRAKALLIVECSQTVFREKYQIDLTPRDIKIPISNLNGKVEISSYIYATQDIERFNSNGFLEDYSAYEFFIEKYDILAADDGYTTKIMFNEDKDKKMSSIFSIVKSSNDELEHMNVSSGSEQIIIEMPSAYFGYHDNMKYNDNFQNVFFAIIAIPALSKCLEEVKHDFFGKYNADINEVINDKTWFASIVNRYKIVYGTELTNDNFIDTDTYEMAQRLLNCGSTKSLEDIYKFIWNLKREGDEDE